MFATAVRALLVVAGLGTMILGIAAIPGPDTVGALIMVAMGGGLVVITVLERQRYRSAEAERGGAAPGPGGGETGGAVDARFQPTAEVFVDPTTGRRMRVLVDPGSGERRYVAEA